MKREPNVDEEGNPFCDHQDCRGWMPASSKDKHGRHWCDGHTVYALAVGREPILLEGREESVDSFTQFLCESYKQEKEHPDEAQT